MPANCSLIGHLVILGVMGSPLSRVAGSDESKPNLPDQRNLQAHLERCERALKASWIVSGQYKLIRSCYSFDSKDEWGAQTILLRFPGLPEVFFWETEEKDNHKEKDGDKASAFKLHIGGLRLFCECRQRGDSKFKLDFGTSRCRWIGGSIGHYDWFLHNGEFKCRSSDSMGFLEEYFEKLMEFLFSRDLVGMLLSLEAKPAQQHYQIKLTKENDQWVYVEVYPLDSRDKRSFTRAQLVIDKGSYLPRRLWYAEPDRTSNLYEITWTIPKT